MSLLQLSCSPKGATPSLDCQKQSQKPKKSAIKVLATRFAEAISNGVCSACNGYYGAAHGQSVCPTCHAFLYANDLDAEVNVQLASVEREGDDSDSDRDSGNEEPIEFVYASARGASGRRQGSVGDGDNAATPEEGAQAANNLAMLDDLDLPLLPPMYSSMMQASSSSGRTQTDFYKGLALICRRFRSRIWLQAPRPPLATRQNRVVEPEVGQAHAPEIGGRPRGPGESRRRHATRGANGDLLVPGRHLALCCRQCLPKMASTIEISNNVRAMVRKFIFFSGKI